MYLSIYESLQTLHESNRLLMFPLKSVTFSSLSILVDGTAIYSAVHAQDLCDTFIFSLAITPINKTP